MNQLNHIAFIMDGNGRWGLKKKNSRNYGHLAGVKVVQKILEASILFKIPIISFYVFSTENWKRPETEINYLFNLINIYFTKEINNIIKNKIKIIITGRLKSLPTKIRKVLKNIGEKGKVSIRNIRREANDELKKLIKDKIISEDENKLFEKNIQKITDENISNIDKIVEEKEKEILQV